MTDDQLPGEFPFVRDETQLKSRIITPDAKTHFESITQDLVLSNHEKEDVEFFRATENLIRFVNVIAMEGKVKEELAQRAVNDNPFYEVALSFYDESAILSTASRGVKGEGAKLLFTQISRMFKRTRGEEPTKAISGMFGQKQRDEEDI
jgi:hypothetical protein